MLYKNGHMNLRKIVSFDNPLEERKNVIFLRTDDNSVIIALGVTFQDETKSCYWTTGRYHQSQQQVNDFMSEQIDDMGFNKKTEVKKKFSDILGWF